MHQLKERMFDLLSDSLSSMKMQISFLAPVMSAPVVSSVLVTKVLLNLSNQLEGFNAGDIESQGIEQNNKYISSWCCSTAIHFTINDRNLHNSSYLPIN